MILTDNQKVAIYSSALQGAITVAHSGIVHTTEGDFTPDEYALHCSDKLIKALEARNQSDPFHQEGD